MDFLTTLTFMGAIFIFMATPGPGTLTIVSRALSSGFKHAIFMSLGMALGDIIFLLLAIFGLNIVAQTFSTLFIIIKVLGGAYLIYLGLKIFMAKTSHFSTNSQKNSSLTREFLSGLFISLSNPKVIAFYVGFLPTFVDLSKLTHKDILLLVFLILSILLTVLTAYAYFANRAKEIIKKPKTQNIMNRFAGSIMMLVGVFLIIMQ